MNQSTAIKLFQDRNIRIVWDEEQEKYYFSIVDVVAVLTESDYQNARNYWKVLKHRLSQEGASESVTNCNQLKMKAADGKYYKTDVADTEELLRIIQSVPSPKAEPFKLWLARVGRERLDELADPEITINRALQTYLDKGYYRTADILDDIADDYKRNAMQDQNSFKKRYF
ncbi:MAG: Bro-N domain-containing protein [Alphaproteobacteria bacterium]|nr:Bro-N domain-containing protein [Alphaproteobacteria bacterium]